MPSRQHTLTRLDVTIAAARIEGTSNPAAAIRALEGVVAEASKRVIPRAEFDARRAIAEIEGRRSREAATKLIEVLRKDARARGFALYAR